MASRWVEAAMALAAALGGVGPGSAQQVRELGVTGTVTASNPALVVGGVYGALRTSRRTRVSLAAGAGAAGGRAAWRGEALGHFLLNPRRLSGAGVYAAGGVAVVGGPVEQGYVVLALGIEGRPGRRSGWFAEAGVGGGARVAMGYRWRWVRGGP